MQIHLDQAASLLFQQIEYFSRLEQADKDMLLPHLSLKQLKKHQEFINEGKKATEIGFVLDGMLRQYYTKEGEEKTTYFFFEGHFVSAYVSCISGKPSLISIEALSTVTYLSFPYSVLLGLFEKSMAWQKFGRLMAEYLTIGLEERMAGLLLQSPEERYYQLLNGSKKKILERIPQHYVASYLGITPVSMSRIRNRAVKKQSSEKKSS